MDRTIPTLSIVLWLASHVAVAQDEIGSSYEIDGSNTDIRLLVYRAGALQRLGHSHVISVGELNGTVNLDAEQPERSSFVLEIPVTALVVDDPALRSEEGEAFSTEPSENDIARTRDNLLGRRVLNAEEFPTIRVTGSGPRDDGSTPTLELSLELLGREIAVSAPAMWALDGDALEVSGSFQLTHDDLGMRRFTALMGALQVANEIDFKYRVRATRVDERRSSSAQAPSAARFSEEEAAAPI